MANGRKSGRERLSGYLYLALLMVVIAVAAQALLRFDDDSPTSPSMTVEGVLTPTPIAEPAPATEPRPTNRNGLRPTKSSLDKTKE
jgi:hypothetical protein